VTDRTALRRRILRRRRQGARTLNLLGGEPTVSLAGILPLLDRLPRGLRVVWNSNMYFGDAAARLLDGAVDVYVADYKCGSPACARRLLGAKDYLEVVRENLRFAHRTADLIIRHLVLPGHAKCCLEPILRWVREEMPEAKLSLRREYLPPAEARHAPVAALSDREYVAARDRAQELGLNVIE
jgi:putative pyruvate formate lyase activating enzyme